ncbi:superoxide dismutase family protein [Aquibacillus koreensis]|uniref:Superoxide dismutase [Cu-Zn] n=1 Tax=Aquibacillus koreensis TaxID=279446 RepID=A0A9X3WIG2_9BACI|nr:superoxide dismutase family protein [Aquibacillus koreensis]MCT2535864.1 superoxide dismutase family protein [Aquibacillus koreensis]MDC3420320.1 superoxide dismutase family protein [Aquibacillus koreensis]
MKKLSFALVLVLLLLASCQSDDRSPLDLTIYNSSDDSIGTVKLSEESDGVKVEVSVEGLEPGLHGIHVHEFPTCEGPDFKSAGNHFDTEGNEHGLMHPDGAHLGDMPNIEVGEDGTVEAELTLSGATLTDGKNSLLQQDGTSIVIHEKQDDGVSQPAGDAGNRIACGVISLSEGNQGEAPTDPTESNEEEE